MWNGKVRRGSTPANWEGMAFPEEKQRLAVIDDRLERKGASVMELVVERRKIMDRCVKRLARKKGKT